MRHCIYLTDLDDTLFRTLAKHDEVADWAEDTHSLKRVTTATNDHHSYMNAAQRGLFAALRATGTVVPVTARSSTALKRVHLDFGTRRAVLANGAVVLDDNGDPIEEWLSRTAKVGRDAHPQMGQMLKTIEREFGDRARSWIVEEYGSPVYLCVKINASHPEIVKAGIDEAREVLTDVFDLSGMQLHINGNNLSITPNGISKQAACRYLIESLGDRNGRPLVGVGDSLTDLPFMALCDFMMLPSRSQLAAEVVLNCSAKGSR